MTLQRRVLLYLALCAPLVWAGGLLFSLDRARFAIGELFDTQCLATLASAVSSGPMRIDRWIASVVPLHAGAVLLRWCEWIRWAADGRTLTAVTAAAALWILARGQRHAAMALVVAVAGNGLLNGALKRTFQRPRPIVELAQASFHGWSFPSGHASGALVAYGMLAYLLWRAEPRRRRIAAPLVAGCLVLAVGVSRVVLGAHLPSDVIAGFASGTVWLCLCVLALQARPDAAGPSRQADA